ncbi:uncharacterized protein PV09_05803 [Verruconis gallopava]|uniref:Uncharacterized protein n=1 Tax=Verruconis gallopava TaxID=253628 RepID=A0A0D2A9A6_9PEZI|nr:uncharacterized protein PV09_05803 [Verruconis gallopava]KIW03160.1 hypothetical protein PV09_05803 [Verruconis gallopava]
MGRWSTFESLKSVLLCGSTFSSGHWHEMEQVYSALHHMKERLHREFAMEKRTVDVRIFIKGFSPCATHAEVSWNASRGRLVHIEAPKPQSRVFNP